MGLHSKRSLPSSFPNKILQAFLIPHTRSTRPATLILTHLIIRTKFLNSTDYGAGHRACFYPQPSSQFIALRSKKPPQNSIWEKTLLKCYQNNKTVYVRHIMFNEWEATCFGPYRTIIRPSYESSQ
jgi:hypothetical protein